MRVRREAVHGVAAGRRGAGAGCAPPANARDTPFADAQRFATSQRVFGLLEQGDAGPALDPERLNESWQRWRGTQEDAE
ncbi:hypothetical protein NB693_25505 [Pantoea ananatis]|uniref:hypothetical protein n=1 Tax=Pantoea ananas TaxID=553 RepID=UPI002220B0E8|nr:hypothetical protein [Pantoea ananatis]